MKQSHASQRCSRERIRGATLVETALTMSLILLVTFGAVQIGLVGYNQVTSDAAAFGYGRSGALGRTHVAAVNETKSAYGQSLQAPTPQTVAAPQGNLSALGLSSVGYGSARSGARHGGMSLVVPEQSVAQTSKSGGSILDIFGGTKTTGTVIEPRMMEDCRHYCLSAQGLFPGSSTNQYVDYFTQGENTTPYYMGFNYLLTCQSATGYTRYNVPNGWDTNRNLITPNPWKKCADAGQYQEQWRALGVAEFLDSANYPSVPNGTVQPPMGTGFDWNQFGTFFGSWCHVRAYAHIAMTLEQPVNAQKPIGVAAQTQFLGSLFADSGQLSSAANNYHWNSEGVGHIIYAMGYNPDPNAQQAQVGWDATDFRNLGNTTNPHGNGNPEWACPYIYPGMDQ